MPAYLSPGVYVEEVPSAVKPIAGVGTSTAGFIGVFPGHKVTNEKVGEGNGERTVFNLAKYPVDIDHKTFKIRVGDVERDDAELTNDRDKKTSNVSFTNAPVNGAIITADYLFAPPDILDSRLYTVTNERIGTGDGTTTKFHLAKHPVVTDSGTFKIRVDNVVVDARLIEETDSSSVQFATAPAKGAVITGDYSFRVIPLTEGEVRLCTSFSDYKNFFGDFSKEPGHRLLTQAVFGFFNNGGSRCYVARAKPKTGIKSILDKFEAIDEISIVAAPGIIDKNVWSDIDAHCRQTTQDRFAIFDCPETVETEINILDTTKLDPSNAGKVLPDNSDYAAFYFPWIKVYDPAENGPVFVPPSGHIAGIYARVDTQRGVHKAPANEPVLGALGLKYRISKAQQQGLNPQGVNCIRDLNGNIFVWGARTIGGDANADLKYINVRRTLLFLRESIDEGLQWVVFEPNTPALWQKIIRNVTAFLTNVWRSEALFGATPQEAFYVRCDETLNTNEVRDEGKVITEIGVSIVRPAEFVIFRVSQFAASGK